MSGFSPKGRRLVPLLVITALTATSLPCYPTGDPTPRHDAQRTTDASAHLTTGNSQTSSWFSVLPKAVQGPPDSARYDDDTNAQGLVAVASEAPSVGAASPPPVAPECTSSKTYLLAPKQGPPA